MINRYILSAVFLISNALFAQSQEVAPKETTTPASLSVKAGDNIIIEGTGIASRMFHHDYLEAAFHAKFPTHNLVIRNTGDDATYPGKRPHSARKNDWAFPGADKFFTGELSETGGNGFYPTPDQWLHKLKADTIIGFWGFNSSFQGPEGIENFKNQLDAYAAHLLSQKYNGENAPQIVWVSPLSLEDLSQKFDVPDPRMVNTNLALYRNAMHEVAKKHNILLIDLFHVSQKWYFDTEEDLTIDSLQLNDKGYQLLAEFMAEKLWGGAADNPRYAAIREAVIEKNWFWHNDFKIPNGVHVYGGRHKPYGPANYPFEIEKIREMTANRDQLIWAKAQGKGFDLAAADAQTKVLPEVKTNFNPRSNKAGQLSFKPGAEAVNMFHLPEGYKIELFASEEKFPELGNPVQMAFDNKGRLWVSTMTSYPHYRPGDPKPKDKLIIFEDTNKDGKADKRIVFTDELHVPSGFEISHDGVYVTYNDDLLFLQDTNGDDIADKKIVVHSGFDTHDTHHAYGAFCADPSGAIFMSEGLFHQTHIETPYGPVHCSDGGFFRYDPVRKKLTRYAQLIIPNPWGVAFDKYGQDFFIHTSSTKFSWMRGSAIKARYGTNLAAPDIITSHHMRPTAGLEILSSRHFPDEVQGDAIICNVIGYRGARVHQLIDSDPGFSTKHSLDLFRSDDPNFRPVDIEVAPDGSLYVVDWHNPLIGHMQHSARDPNRDHKHGRIYRITYPARPLVEPAKIAGADIDTLLNNLRLPESRSRYRTRRELRGRNPDDVLPKLTQWVANLQGSSEEIEHAKLEALWVSWGFNQIDVTLLKELASSDDHRLRSAAMYALRFNTDKVDNYLELITKAANDPHGRLRIDALNNASDLSAQEALPIINKVGETVNEGLTAQAVKASRAIVQGKKPKLPKRKSIAAHLKGKDFKVYEHGAEIYEREGYCGTCHQEDGKGLKDSGFPPLNGTKWVKESKERLIKLTLNGLHGPIRVSKKDYPGLVPMTGFGGMLNDEEIAAVLSFVRNSFGNKESLVTPEEVAKVREATKDKVGFYDPAELLEMHPHK